MSKQQINRTAETFLLERLDAIVDSSATTRQKIRDFQALLDMPPNKEWVFMHPYTNSLYMPIGYIESLLKLLFGRYTITITHQVAVFNSIQVGVRVSYQCPITGAMLHQDGVGAKDLQTKSQTGVLKIDFSNVIPHAVVMALPIAKSTAIKDACDHIGKIFGSDIAREKTLTSNESARFANGWNAFLANDPRLPILYKEVTQLIEACNTVDELGLLYNGDIKALCEGAEQSIHIFTQVVKSRIDKINNKIIQPTLMQPRNNDLADLTEAQIQHLQIQNSLAND
jgi:hypothetical protein